MERYKVKIFPEALEDINYATKWYNDQVPNFGFRFQKQVINQINKLKVNAEIYIFRYKDVRCMVINKFPFMVHFILDLENKTIRIIAVLHTSLHPKIWEKRSK